MSYSDIERIIGLAVVAIIALGAVLLLLRLGSSDSTQERASGALLGYPPERFPDRAVARSEPLVALAATQSRLTLIYSQITPKSDLAIWLRAFLDELRAMMDTAYRVALVTQVYGQPPQLERLVAEVQQIEEQLAREVTRRLLADDGDARNELLEGRLATLRLCARELAYSQHVSDSD